MPFLKYRRLKLKLRVLLAGHSVAMVIYRVTKIIPKCLPVHEEEKQGPFCLVVKQSSLVNYKIELPLCLHK